MSEKFIHVKGCSLSSSLSLFLFIAVFLIVAGCKKTYTDPNSVSRSSHGLVNTKAMDLKVVSDNFVSPVTVVEPPDGSHRLFVVDQVGQIWIVNQQGQKRSQPFIDIASKMVTLSPFYDERGLLGLALQNQWKILFVLHRSPATWRTNRSDWQHRLANDMG